MVVFPPCKINLGLRVVAKRKDGYHDLETCFYPLPWTDILEAIPSKELQFAYTGYVIPGNASDNLCAKAYSLLREDFDIGPVSMHLHKIIPMGAGLGGGSADGAYMLRLLNQLFSLQLNREQLIGYAAQLGSDCAFFVGDEPMIGGGRGEILTPTDLSLRGTYAVLLKPDLHISTAEAFARIIPKPSPVPVNEIVTGDRAQWRALLHNDFEDSLFPAYPILSQLKARFYGAGAWYAGMSGTGSTVFGLFDEKPDVTAEQGMVRWEGWL